MVAPDFTRRKLLTAAATATTATTLGVGSNLISAEGCKTSSSTSCALPQPQNAPFDTVVVLMMENRSFDHMLEWLPSAKSGRLLP